MRVLGACAAVALALPAFAADVQILTESDGVTPRWLLEPAPGTFYETGIGHPSVAYDAASDTYAMLFETKLTPTYIASLPGDYSGCSQVWAIGLATSADGMSWNIEETPVLLPEPATYRACVIAHPTLVREDATWHLWFKAHDEAGQTGVGYASSEDLHAWTASAAPVLQLTDFGFPAVVKLEGTWYMLLAQVPSLYLAVSETPDADWQMNIDPVFEPGRALWMDDRVYNPAMTCYDRGEATHPFVLFFGGKNMDETSPNTILTSGFGKATSPDATDWWLDATSSPAFEWEGDGLWRHWETMRVGDDFLVWYNEKDPEGKNRVGFAATTFTWDEGEISSRICVVPSDTGDTGDTADTGDSGDTDTDTDSGADDTGEPPDDKCGCDAAGGAAPALPGLLGLLLLRRRRG